MSLNPVGVKRSITVDPVHVKRIRSKYCKITSVHINSMAWVKGANSLESTVHQNSPKAVP